MPNPILINPDPVRVQIAAADDLPPIELLVWPDPRAAPDDAQRVLSVLVLGMLTLQRQAAMMRNQVAALAIVATSQLRAEPFPVPDERDAVLTACDPMPAAERLRLSIAAVQQLADGTTIRQAPIEQLPE